MPDTCHESCQAGDIGVVTGWNPETDEPWKYHLEKIVAPIWQYDECMEMLGNLKYPFGDSHFCGGFTIGGMSTCSGDSGAGLLCYSAVKGRFVLDGVASWGVTPCDSDYPSVFGKTCTDSFKKWIEYLRD